MTLSPKDEIFVAEYLATLDPQKAALAAGFAPSTARTKAYMWASNRKTKPEVFDAIRAGMAKRHDRLEATGENVVEGLRRIAFFDARRLGRWGSREITEEVTEKGSKRTVRRKVNVPYMDLVDSDELDDETAMAIAGIEMGPNGPKIRLADRRAALVDLGRHLGLFKDENQGLQPVTFIIKYADDRPTKTADEEAA